MEVMLTSVLLRFYMKSKDKEKSKNVVVVTTRKKIWLKRKQYDRPKYSQKKLHNIHSMFFILSLLNMFVMKQHEIICMMHTSCWMWNDQRSSEKKKI